MCCGLRAARLPEIGRFSSRPRLCSLFGLRVGAAGGFLNSTTYARGFVVNQGCRSGIKRCDQVPLRRPLRRQRISMKPQQAHAAGLLPGQDGLDDGGLQEGQTEQLVDRRMVKPLPARDAAGDRAVVEQLQPVEGAR